MCVCVCVYVCVCVCVCVCEAPNLVKNVKLGHNLSLFFLCSVQRYHLHCHYHLRWLMKRPDKNRFKKPVRQDYITCFSSPVHCPSVSVSQDLEVLQVLSGNLVGSHDFVAGSCEVM